MSQETHIEVFSVLDYHQDILELESFVRLSLVGIKFVADNIDSKLADQPHPSTKTDQNLAQFRTLFRSPIVDDMEIAQFAKSQYADFPYLVGISVIRLWTILEVAADELALHYLKTLPKSREREAVKKIKGPLIDFVTLSPEDQAEYLLEQLKQDLKANLKSGISRFEDVFNVLAVGSSVEEIVRDTLFELSEVRNVLTHRNGRVDTRLMAHCPRLKLKVGENLRLTPEHLYAYFAASAWYINELMRRQAKAETGEDYGSTIEYVETQIYLISQIQSRISQ